MHPSTLSDGPRGATPSRGFGVQDYDAQFAAATADVLKLAGELNDAQGEWRASPAQWSIAECLAHLAATGRVYLPAIEDACGMAGQRVAPPVAIPSWCCGPVAHLLHGAATPSDHARPVGDYARRIFADPYHSPIVRDDLRAGLSALPIWMQEFLRDLIGAAMSLKGDAPSSTELTPGLLRGVSSDQPVQSFFPVSISYAISYETRS